jgi:hypothetical protein
MVPETHGVRLSVRGVLNAPLASGHRAFFGWLYYCAGNIFLDHGA